MQQQAPLSHQHEMNTSGSVRPASTAQHTQQATTHTLPWGSASLNPTVNRLSDLPSPQNLLSACGTAKEQCGYLQAGSLWGLQLQARNPTKNPVPPRSAAMLAAITRSNWAVRCQFSPCKYCSQCPWQHKRHPPATVSFAGCSTKDMAQYPNCTHNQSS